MVNQMVFESKLNEKITNSFVSNFIHLYSKYKSYSKLILTIILIVKSKAAFNNGFSFQMQFQFNLILFAGEHSDHE
jgi:hypothetical protein